MPLGRSLLIIRPVDTNLVWAGNSAGFAVAVAPELFALEKRATSLGGFQFADPDVAVAHWMVMVLQRQRQFFRLRFVRRPFAVSRRAAQFHVVLHEDAVMKHGDAGGAQQLSILIEARAVKNDIVDLPLAGRARSVH